MAPPDLPALWKQYKQEKNPDAKRQLITHYVSLVKYVAERMAINLPPHIEVNDLINDGVIGLMDALEKFDPERGIKFETYASTRVHGAILDSLRALDWVPRRVRKKAREVEQAYQAVESLLGRAPTEEEVASHLNMNPEDLQKELLAISGTALLSLDEVFYGESGDLSLIEMIRELREGPEEETVRKDVEKVLRKAIEDLPPKEKLVVALYYYEELTLKEITQVLQLSEARISQLHTQAVIRLKNRLRTALGGLRQHNLSEPGRPK